MAMQRLQGETNFLLRHALLLCHMGQQGDIAAIQWEGAEDGDFQVGDFPHVVVAHAAPRSTPRAHVATFRRWAATAIITPSASSCDMSPG